MASKFCLHCNKEFFKKVSEGMPYWNTRSYCSQKCNAICRKTYIRTPEHKEIMKLAVAHLDRKECGQRFIEINKNKKGKTIEEIYGNEKAINIRKKLIKFGAENNNWKGGTSFKDYGHEFNKKLKNEIKERDGMICLNCFVTDKHEADNDVFNRGLTIHHIDYDKKNNDKLNLITLCRRCNSLANSNRGTWKIKYQQLLSV